MEKITEIKNITADPYAYCISIRLKQAITALFPWSKDYKK
jgi:hypothetical protein